MDWQTVAGQGLTYEEQRARIRAGIGLVDAINGGGQVVTPRVVEALTSLATHGLMWMIYWHLLLEDGANFDDMSADQIEAGVKETMQEMRN